MNGGKGVLCQVIGAVELSIDLYGHLRAHLGTKGVACAKVFRVFKTGVMVTHRINPVR